MDLTLALRGDRVDRVALLESLRASAGAELAALFDLREAGGRVWFGDFTVVGPSPAVRDWSFSGTPFHGLWSPHAPGRSRNRFRSGLAPDNAFHRAYYAPYGIHWQRRMLVFDGGQFAGWIGVQRTVDQSPFRPREDHRLRQATDTLIAAVQVERRRIDGVGSGPTVVLRPDGSIDTATEGLPFDAHERDALAARTRRYDRGEVPGTLVLRGLFGRAVRLVGDGGGSRYCWTFAPTRPVTRGPLTPRQRRAAQLAAVGWATAEIAIDLGIAVETAKQHLDAVYGRLGVASRVELRRALEEAPWT